MGLTLVTGPANSAKAAVVLERHRAALPRGAILVVPSAADVEHYRRELALEGAVLGVRVEPFGGLLREIARRAGVAEVAIGEPARERLIGAVVERTPLQMLAAASEGPRFVAALAGFVAELEARRVTPARLHAALRAWAPAETARARYAEELAGLYGGYRRALERLGRLDRELLWTRALDALRLDPERWGRTPVFLYGFDDLDPLQLDAVETLAHHVGAPVTISLPGEPGRVALAGRAATLETLRPGAEEVIALDPSATYYEDAALHHLERSLFEDTAAPGAAGDGAVELLEGGDERAEAELVAAEIVALVAGGCAPGEIAVVTRGAASVGTLVAALLREWGVPCAAVRRERFADTALGGGLIALLRAALIGGGADQLVRWLRVPGVVRETAFVDRFEAALLAGGVSELSVARERWEREHWPLDALGRLADAAGRRGPALLERVEAELDGLFSAPWRREAALLDPWQAAVLAAGRRALRDLRELARADPTLAPAPAAIVAALERVSVELRGAGEGAAVLVCDALALRARRVRALFIAGVQEGLFPALAREQPFLSAAERAELAQASGLVLGSPGEPLDAERYLFYALCSRPTRWLRVSWHDATDDGEPALRSLFVDDLVDCFGEGLLDTRRVRGAGTLRWAQSPAAALDAIAGVLRGPRRTGPVIAPLSDPAALQALRGHAAHSASALEKWTACPVAWFVERGLGARALAPDATPLLRGAAAHRALQAVLEGLRERAGSARVDAATLPAALELLDEVLAAPAPALAPSVAGDRAERHRLRSDLARYLSFAAAAPGTLEPREFELAFGLPGDPLPPASLGEGALSLCGRIDRIDLDAAGTVGLIYDYKAASGVEPAARWAAAGLLQPALYMLALEQLLGVDAVGGLYQPLRKPDMRPRGAVRDGVSPAGGLVETDRRSAQELRELIAEQLAAALAAAGELTAGELVPRPPSCSRDGGCRHPAICRAEAR